MMRFPAAQCIVLALLTAGLGHAQQDTKPPSVPSLEQLRELGNPGFEHRTLARYAGEWALEIRLGRGSSVASYRGSSRNRMVAGDRFLLCEFDARSQNEQAAGVLTLGFDRRHGEYTIQSLDSWGTYFVTARGKPGAAAGPIKLSGKDDDPYLKSITGQDKEFVFELDLTAGDALTIKVYMIDNRTPARREMLMMEYRFTKGP